MQRENEVQHVFLVGAKSLGAYGGYETFVYKLTEYHQNKKNIKYHVACKANGDGCMDETKVDGVTRINDQEFEFHNAHCFKIDIPQIGPAQAIYYDVAALKACCKYIKEHRIKHPIVYIMACRIGPFAGHFYKEIHKLGGTVYLNPDGHEWMRAKWSEPIRKYWKMSEQMMVKYSDLDICDSLEIEKYIHEQYDGKGIKGRDPKTTFIAYGAETRKSVLADDDAKLVEWYEKKGLKPKEYYLVVGRFVPENNYETMIREFMKSKTKKDFAIITNVNDKFLAELEERLHFKSGVILGDHVVLGRNTRIECTGSLQHVGIGIKIGNDTSFGSDCYFGAAGGIEVGSNVVAGQYIRFHSENHNYDDLDVLIKDQGVSHKGIRVGSNCWIGAGAVFIDGAELCDGCVVAANAVITKKFPPNSVVGGVPAKIIKMRE